MAPAAPAAGAGAPGRAPGPTNVLILSKIPDGISEQQIASGAGRYSEVLQVSYRKADPDGPGWAFIAFATPELAKMARERLDGKALPGTMSSVLVDANLGEGLFGNLRSNDQNTPWKEARTPQGQVYYYHNVTRQTSWTKPPPEFSPVAPGTVPPPPAGVPPQATLTAQRGAAPYMAASQPRRPLLSGMLPPGVNQPPQAQAQAAIQAAQAAVAANQTSPADSGPTNVGPVGANLFIYHIPNSWDDNILRQHFEHFGKIVSCRVQKDGDGRPRGFGFVSYDAAAAAQAAIAGMHGFPVEGKHLKVQLKKGDEQQLAPPVPSLGGLGGHGMPGMVDLTSMPHNQPPPPPGLPPGLSPGFMPVRPPDMPGLGRPGPY